MIDRTSATFGDERQGAARYLDAIRDHWLLILALVVLAVGASAFYSKTAQKRYQSEADILVSPVSGNDPAFIGMPLLTDTNGVGRPVVTAARFVTTPEIAEAVARQVGLPGREAASNSVNVTPVGQSNIVSIVGLGHTAARATAIANAFADQTIAQRTARFQTSLQATIRRLNSALEAIPPGQRAVSAQAQAYQQRLGSLTGLVGTPDPTIQVLSRAVEPSTPVWPRPVLSVVVAFLASLLLGTGAAIALELVSPRIKREDELLLSQRLPILARVPRMPKRVVRGYLTGRSPLPGDVREAYRTLRASLAGSGPGDRAPHTILITSAVPGEGKTMTSVNLAITLALAGTRTILVDGDLRRPMVATVFGAATHTRGFANVLTGEATVEDSLVQAPGHGDSLKLLLASPENAQLVDLLEPDRVERVLAELRLYADVVIVDSPPITEVADALNLADAVEAVVVAVRLGRSRRDRLNELRRMVAQRGVSLAGFVVTTNDRRRGKGYYYGSGSAQEIASPREKPVKEKKRKDRRAAKAAPAIQAPPPPPDPAPEPAPAPAPPPAAAPSVPAAPAPPAAERVPEPAVVPGDGEPEDF